MVTNIRDFKILKESILVPRNLDDRHDKLKQKNYQMLQQETIYGDLIIGLDFLPDNIDINSIQIKTKTIAGNVELKHGEMDHIPHWLENIEILGFFSCEHNNLTSLKGCPKIIKDDFYCNHNNLTSLEYGPTYVGGIYDCSKNQLTSLKGIPEIINKQLFANHNKINTLKYFPKEIKGLLNLMHNDLNISRREVRDICKVDNMLI